MDCHKKLEIVVSKYKSTKSISSYYSTSLESPNKKVQDPLLELKMPSSSSSHSNKIQSEISSEREEINENEKKRKIDFGMVNVEDDTIDIDSELMPCNVKIKEVIKERLIGGKREEEEEERKSNQFGIDVTEDDDDNNDFIEYEKKENATKTTPEKKRLLESEQFNEKYSNNNSNFEITESNDFFQNCFICNIDISNFSESGKEHHINNCCHKLDNKNAHTPIISPEKKNKISSQSSSQSSEIKKGKKRTIENYFLSNTAKN